MKYVRQEINDWLSTNIVKDFDDYDSTVTYSYEDINSDPTNSSVVTYKGYYWRSLIDNNTGNNPELTENKYWNKWKVANVNAMLDQKSLTSTTSTSSIVVEFKRGLSDTIGLGYIESSKVTIEHLKADDTVLTDFTQEFLFGVNEEVYDYWSYIYEPYSEQADRTLYIPIATVGYKIKVTIDLSANNKAGCGFLICGEAQSMGCTLDAVGFNFNSFSTTEVDNFGNTTIIKRDIQDLVDFETAIDKGLVSKARRDIKKIYDDVIMFVVDDSKTSNFENIITLGKIQDASIVGSNFSKNFITWSVMETI